MDGEEEGTVSVGFCTRTAGAKFGRWNPTAEQVKVLMDLFRAGIRTPSTEQIQNITSQISCYGEIESKNVFYWFQNHKARERHHKKRRRGGDAHHAPLLAPCKREARNCATVDEDLFQEERQIETLELFPMKSYNLEQERARVTRNECCKDIHLMDAGRDLPPDLRLSFS